MLFVITGGTIDKKPVYLADGKTFDNNSKSFKKTHINKMLKEARYQGQHSVETLFMIDSLDMADEHRKQISDLLEKSKDTQIVITHGTDKMPETARFLENNEQLASKTIVLTGAMLPYSIGAGSDAMFNLGTAVAYAQSMPAGVYVAMNGRAFSASNVQKDSSVGRFKEAE